MNDVVAALWRSESDLRALGRVISGLSVLCGRYEQLWLIVEGQAPIPIESKDIGLTLGGVAIGGRLLVPLCDIKAWERDCGEPCVIFEMSGKDAMFAPATAPDDDAFIKEIDLFLKNDWYDEDTVYLTNLDGSVGDPAGCKELSEPEIAVLRKPGLPADGPLLSTDTLRVLREDMVLGDITWAERDNDGDGNRHLHVVLNDGRYRRISLGDLGR